MAKTLVTLLSGWGGVLIMRLGCRLCYRSENSALLLESFANIDNVCAVECGGDARSMSRRETGAHHSDGGVSAWISPYVASREVQVRQVP